MNVQSEDVENYIPNTSTVVVEHIVAEEAKEYVLSETQVRVIHVLVYCPLNVYEK